MLYEKKESLNKAIELTKMAMEMTRAKMSKKLSNMITGSLVNSIHGKVTIAGDVTISKDLKQIRVRFNINLFAGYVENESLATAWNFILTTVRHECLHAFQWAWVAKRAGYKGIQKMADYISNHDYATSVLEKGARMYENINNAALQDFETDLAIFVA